MSSLIIHLGYLIVSLFLYMKDKVFRNNTHLYFVCKIILRLLQDIDRSMNMKIRMLGYLFYVAVSERSSATQAPRHPLVHKASKARFSSD